jgi:hypothetical protein
MSRARPLGRGFTSRSNRRGTLHAVQYAHVKTLADEPQKRLVSVCRARGLGENFLSRNGGAQATQVKTHDSLKGLGHPMKHAAVGLVLSAIASVLFIGCGSSDISPSDKNSEGLSSSANGASRGPSSGAAGPSACPVGKKLCTLGGFGGTPCVHECVIDTALCGAAPQCETLTCPAGEKICTFGDPASSGGSPEPSTATGSPEPSRTSPSGGPSSGVAPGCFTKCVPDTWLCVAPPQCGGLVCDPACTSTQRCCPGPEMGTTLCLNPDQLDDGACPKLP